MIASGERIAHYQIVRKLGQGGMGEVYLAVDERLGRNVAVKLLPPAQADEVASQARLVREAQAASHLNHPNIVTVHDVGVWGGRVYLVMELVEGRRVGELIQRGLRPREALLLCAQAARGLAAAHARGILHRDVKPDNLMVTDDGRLKILDFGLAKLRSLDDTPAPPPDPAAGAGPLDALLPTAVHAPATPDADLSSAPTLAQSGDLGAPPRLASRPGQAAPRGRESTPHLTPWPSAESAGDALLTEADSLLGTPAYMSPEHAARRPVDARSEIYSLGLVLYEMLTRTRPLARDTLDATIAAAAAGEVPALGAAVPRPVARVLRRALARDPADRHRDMTELATALEGAARALAGRRARRLAALGLAAAALATGAAIVASRGDDDDVRFRVRHQITLTADPGCEEYPVFTPDGGEIIYDGIVDGDTEILAIAVDGGARRRLTHSPGWDLGAAVSPDGRHVAYVHFGEHGRELRVLGIEGDRAAPPRTVGAIRGMPAWSRSGEILYGDDAGVISRAAIGDAEVRPVEVARLPPDHVPVYLDEFPDGELVVLMRSRAQTSAQATLARVRPGQIATPWSPPTRAGDWAHVRVDRDGRGVYYGAHVPSSAGRALQWQPRRGGEAVVIDSTQAMAKSYAIAPRANGVVYSTCDTRTLVGRLRSEAGFEPLARLGAEWEPSAFAPLPDGGVVVASMRGSSIAQLWRVDPRGAADRLVEEPAKRPVISPDGRVLAWAGVPPGSRGIFVRPLDGGPVRQLTDGASDDDPAFSHDGATIYFTRTDEDATRVYARAVDGDAAAVPVTPGGVTRFAADPARDRIAVVVVEGSRRSVQVAAPGGPPRELALDERPYDLIAFTAGGTRLALSASPNELFEVAIDPDGNVGPPQPLWQSPVEVLHQLIATPDGELWALVSAEEGDLYLLYGSFR